VLVIFAALALVFTGRYPSGVFDFVVGLDRWVARVAAYVFLMRDEYPPFRLDQGGHDPMSGPAHPEAVAPEPGAATATEEPPATKSRSTAGRVALVIVGVLTGIVAFALLVGGCALVAVDRTQRDDDGFLMSPTRDFASPTYAIVSESADIDSGGGEWALDTFLGTIRIRSDSERPLFVGIAPTADVDRYLEGVEHDAVDDLDTTGDPEYSRRSGRAPPAPPDTRTFWVASRSGTGEQALDWEPEDGFWRVVVMNEDASRGVSADMSIGAELDPVLWIGVGLLVLGALLAAGAALAVTAGARRRDS
jgi:hypothetical protein